MLLQGRPGRCRSQGGAQKTLKPNKGCKLTSIGLPLLLLLLLLGSRACGRWIYRRKYVALVPLSACTRRPAAWHAPCYFSVQILLGTFRLLLTS